MEFAATLGLIRRAVEGVKTCGECTRLEALVLSERNRGNDLLHLLNEANNRLEIERESYGLLEERFLIAIGAIKVEDKVSGDTVTIKPYGGVETLRQKQTRMSLVSRKKRDERLKTDSKVSEG